MVKTLKALLIGAVLILGTHHVQAASCWHQSFYALCTGCTITLDWKIKRFDKSQTKRWCRFSFGPSTNYRRGFTVVDGFSLGELRTGYDNVRISGLKTGKDRVTVQLNGIDKFGQNYVSTIHFNVEVVEGEF